jgi:hypothetical protein
MKYDLVFHLKIGTDWGQTVQKHHIMMKGREPFSLEEGFVHVCALFALERVAKRLFRALMSCFAEDYCESLS